MEGGAVSPFAPESANLHGSHKLYLPHADHDGRAFAFRYASAVRGITTLTIGTRRICELLGIAACVSVVRLRLAFVERARFQHLYSFSLHSDVDIPDIGIRDSVRFSDEIASWRRRPIR